MEQITSSVEAEPIYSDGEKTYAISKAKWEREGLKQPAGGKEVEEFFKKHADRLTVNEKDVPVVEVDVGGAVGRG